MSNILNILQSGLSQMENPKFRGITNSMMWRQKYMNSEFAFIHLDDGRVLNIKQLVDTNGNNSTVTEQCVRPASYVLSKFLDIKYPSKMSELNVCDIGTGTGCVGLFAAALGAKVTLIYLNNTPSLVKENKDRVCKDFPDIDSDNITISVHELDGTSSVEQFDIPFDIILVSDYVLSQKADINLLIQVCSYTLFVVYTLYHLILYVETCRLLHQL